LPKLPRLNGCNRRAQRNRRCDNAPQFVGGKFQNGDMPSGEVLLITQILIGGDEQVEFLFRQLELEAAMTEKPA